jgi:hypothetical protein
MLRSVTGLDNVSFGTDYPYPSNAISIGGLHHLQGRLNSTTASVTTFLGGCAARLIPRLARVESTI